MKIDVNKLIEEKNQENAAQAERKARDLVREITTLQARQKTDAARVIECQKELKELEYEAHNPTDILGS